MAENESNVGKEFALDLKIEKNSERKKVGEKIKFESKNPYLNSLLNIQMGKDGKYELILLGKSIGSIDENDNVSYYINGLKEVREKLESSDRPSVEYSDLGLPDIEYLEYLEKEKDQKLKEEQGENKDGQEEQSDEEQKQKEEDDEEEKEEEKEEEEKELDEGQEETKGLLELNLAVLELINPKLRGCTAAYLNPRTNSLVIKDKFGKERSPEEFGFEEKKVEGGNFALSKMDEKGEISSNENPTKLYAIKGSDYAVTTDFKTHHREINIAVKGRDANHANDYSILKGNLGRYDTGEKSKFKGAEETGFYAEGWNAGNQDKTNEKAKGILKGLNSEDKKKFEQGFADKVSDEHRMNDQKDLKETVKEILVKKYKVREVTAEEIAGKMVEEGKNYREIMKEESEGRGPWEGPSDPRRG